MYRALNALYLQVPAEVAKDVSVAVQWAYNEAIAERGATASELAACKLALDSAVRKLNAVRASRHFWSDGCTAASKEADTLRAQLAEAREVIKPLGSELLTKPIIGTHDEIVKTLGRIFLDKLPLFQAAAAKPQWKVIRGGCHLRSS
jgi:hypothetical protein